MTNAGCGPHIGALAGYGNMSLMIGDALNRCEYKCGKAAFAVIFMGSSPLLALVRPWPRPGNAAILMLGVLFEPLADR